MSRIFSWPGEDLHDIEVVLRKESKLKVTVDLAKRQEDTFLEENLSVREGWELEWTQE